MGQFLDVTDLTPFAAGIDSTRAEAMIDDAEALAVLAAPCIAESTFENGDAVRAILRGAVLRWHETGSGALQSQAAGPFSQTVDTRPDRKGMFWPSELVQLRGLCASGTNLYTVSLAGPDPVTTSEELGW